MKLLLPFVCLLGALALSAQSEPAPQPKPKAKSSAPAKPKAAAPKGPGKRYKLPESELVNINAASKSELMARLGLDAATADRLIKARPYKSKADLVTKKVMPETQWQGLRHNIIAKQPTAQP